MRQLWLILMATESNGLILLEPPDTRDGLTVVSTLPQESDFPDGATVVPTLPQEGDVPLSSTELNDESMQISSIKSTVSDIQDVMQISPIKTTVSGIEGAMQISPIKTSVSGKEDVMQISPIKRSVSGKEDVMQISTIKTCLSDKDVMQISPIKTTGSDKEDIMEISPKMSTVSDIEDVNLISLKHPDTAIDSKAEVGLPASFSDKKIGMQHDILTGGNTKGVSSLCSTDKDEEEDRIEHVAKKLKIDKDTKIERRKSLDAAIKQTSEIVLVLAGMGRMRAGRCPTDFERGLMTEARQKLGYLAGKLAPKDLVSKDAVENMIEDLGLNRVKDPTKTAVPKKSIAERSLETMKKIEQARQLTTGAPMLPTSLAKAEHSSVNSTSHGTSSALTNQGAQPAPVKLSPSISQPLPGAQLLMPAISVTPRAAIAQSVSIEPRTPVVTAASVVRQAPGGPTLLVSQQAQDSLKAPVALFAHVAQAAETKPPVVALPTTRVLQPVPEAQSLLQKPGEVVKPLAAPGIISEENTKPLSAEAARAVGREHSKDSVNSTSKVLPLVQTSTSSANIGKDVDVHAKIPRKLENLHMIQTPQGLKPAESLAIRANHADIARNVQKILQSRPPDFRQWEPPSKAYMSAPVSCQICKINVIDIDSILVCDACEKAVHLKCIQSYNQRGIPKGDWHCPKCLIASNGRPFPPKYGRVGKSTIVRKMPANKSSHQASPTKKIETSHPKSPQHTIVSNGLNTAPDIPVHVDLSRSNHMHILQETGNTSGDLRSNSELSFAESRKNAEDVSNEPLNHDFSQQAPEAVNALLGKLPENENNCSPSNTVSHFPDQQSALSAALVSASQFGSKGSQTGDQSSINLHVVKQPQTSSNSQGADRLRMQQEASASETLLQNNEIQRVPAETKGLPFSEFPMAGQNRAAIGSDSCQQGEDAQRRTLHKNSVLDAKSLSEGINQNRSTEGEDAYRVEWVGDKLQVTGGKTYYQSCSVRGVLYKLHDYALFRPETPNVPPYIARLQILWEDDDTGSKWVRVNWCYYPNDIPQMVRRPTPPEKDEVYESNHGDNNLVGSIQGPCQVLPSENYKEEIEKRMTLLKGGHEVPAFHPVFLCKWFYDAQKGNFHSVRY